MTTTAPATSRADTSLTGFGKWNNSRIAHPSWSLSTGLVRYCFLAPGDDRVGEAPQPVHRQLDDIAGDQPRVRLGAVDEGQLQDAAGAAGAGADHVARLDAGAPPLAFAHPADPVVHVR